MAILNELNGPSIPNEKIVETGKKKKKAAKKSNGKII